MLPWAAPRGPEHIGSEMVTSIKLSACALPKPIDDGSNALCGRPTPTRPASPPQTPPPPPSSACAFVNALVCFSSSFFAFSASASTAVAAPSASGSSSCSDSELPDAVPAPRDGESLGTAHALAHCSVAAGARRESGSTAGSCSHRVRRRSIDAAKGVRSGAGVRTPRPRRGAGTVEVFRQAHAHACVEASCGRRTSHLAPPPSPPPAD